MDFVASLRVKRRRRLETTIRRSARALADSLVEAVSQPR
jgi:hypothetical protein